MKLVRGVFIFRKNGFALAEVMVAIFFITLAILLVGALSTQVMNLSKSSRQSGIVIEFRNRTNAMTKNSAPWLSKMRSNASVGSLFSGCLPDSTAAATGFSCPVVDDSLLVSDPGLAELASGGLHPVSTPIVDMMGQQIAGSLSAPLYLDNDGRLCTQTPAETTCPMISTGYFLRKDPGTDTNPGYVRFAVKIAQNFQAVKQKMGVNTMKPQYMSMDIGTDWNISSAECPSGTAKVGYGPSGNPICENPNISCTSGTVSVGADSTGKPICKALPTCSPDQSTVLDSGTNSLVCSGGTPCGNGQLFLGYIAGTGAPMCSSPDVKCPSGQVQTGLETQGGKLQAQCEALPSCNDSQKISYDGSKFVCVATIASVQCSSNQYVSGVDDNGKVVCTDRTIASTTNCADGEFVYALDATGNVLCRADQVGGSASSASSSAGACTRQFTSNEYDVDASFSAGYLEIPHNLGVVPDQINMVLVNKQAVDGYNPGDEIHLSPYMAGQGAPDWNLSASSTKLTLALFAGATNLNLTFIAQAGQNPTAPDRRGTFSDPATRAKWKLKFYAAKLGSCEGGASSATAGWANLPAGTPFHNNQYGTWAEWSDGQDHSLTKICQDAGFTAFAGTCRTQDGSALYECHGASQRKSGNWRVDCNCDGGSGSEYMANQQTTFLCVK